MAVRKIAGRLRWSKPVQAAERAIKRSLIFLTDWLFDLRYGTDTAGQVFEAAIGAAPREGNTPLKYQATVEAHFNQLISHAGIQPANSVLVDVGSGKGRVLMLGLKAGFSKVVGIEFSRPLCEIAETNLQKFTTGAKERFHIEHTDAAKYAFKPDENVFFFFNPFNCEIMITVLANLLDSVRRQPRRIWVLYYGIAADNPFSDYPEFILQASVDFEHGKLWQLPGPGRDARIYVCDGEALIMAGAAA